MIIHTNAPVNCTYAIEDQDGVFQTIPAGTYKAQIKNSIDDTVPLLTFQSLGGPGIGAITKTTAVISGQTVDVLVFTAGQALVANLEPGGYLLDILRTDAPEWVFDDAVTVIKGITAP